MARPLDMHPTLTTPTPPRHLPPPLTLVREYVFIVFTFHLVLVCFLFSFFSHFHEDITNLTEITCARRVAAGPGRVRVKIVISVTVTDSVYTGPSRLGVLSWAGRLRGAPLAVFADASV